MQYIDTALLILCLSGLLGLRVWTYGQLQEIRERMAKHEGRAEVHVDASTFVKKEVCEMQVRLINQGVHGVKENLVKLEQAVNAVIRKLDRLIEQKQKDSA